MKIKASDVKTETRWFHFNDGWSVKVEHWRQCYLAVLYDTDGNASYGWHPIPHSSLHIPTQCNNWNLVKFAVTEHAKQHGGLYEFSATV